MPDEFGDIDVDDLNQLREELKEDIETLTKYIRESHMNNTLNTFLPAQVLEHVTANTPQEHDSGVGSIKVRIPRLKLEENNNIWAKPLRMTGQFSFPDIDSWVFVYFFEGAPEYPYYIGAEFFDNTVSYADQEINAENIGFFPPVPDPTLAPTAPLPNTCLLYTSPSPRDRQKSRMPSSA